MTKTLLYRLFGFGKMPENLKAELEREGLILVDEGLKGSVTYRNFRAPGRVASWSRQSFTASVALTNLRLLALSYANPVINVPLTDDRLRAMRFSIENGDALCVAFDAALFHSDWSGTIEYRFRTSEAQRCLTLVQQHLR